MADGIQLLPETRKSIQVIRPKERRQFFLGLGILVVVFVFYFVLGFYLDTKENALGVVSGQISDLEKTRNKNTETEILKVVKQISASTALISNHTFWSLGLGRIERLIQGDVQLDNLNLELSQNSINFSAQASGFISVARQVSGLLADDSIVNIELNQVKSLANGRVSFFMTIIFNPQKFFAR
ncbi:MAG: hypothetical protein HYW77_02720 [Parcubacteria group bacterium]|nr:hypothetical protein [Parcubacteria group bacterium]